jgi:hypothetical protein
MFVEPDTSAMVNSAPLHSFLDGTIDIRGKLIKTVTIRGVPYSCKKNCFASETIIKYIQNELKMSNDDIINKPELKNIVSFTDADFSQRSAEVSGVWYYCNLSGDSSLRQVCKIAMAFYIMPNEITITWADRVKKTKEDDTEESLFDDLDIDM